MMSDYCEYLVLDKAGCFCQNVFGCQYSSKNEQLYQSVKLDTGEKILNKLEQCLLYEISHNDTHYG